MPYFIIKMLGPKYVMYFAEKGFKWAIKALVEMNGKDEHEKNAEDLTTKQSETTKEV